jgi:predicted DCC family thiol-disulfide oxidoreductase YuxK
MTFDGADNVIRVMLFWMIFMPSGARYSIDAVLAGARGEPVRETGPALPIRLGQLQIAWTYLNTATHKWPGKTWHDGTALHYALGLDHLFTRSLGRLLYHWPWFTKFGTHFTVVAECSFLPLVFIPLFQTRAVKKWLDRQSATTKRTLSLFFQPTYKALAIACGTALHLGIATMMSVGNFSYVMISSYLLLFETAWTVAIVDTLGRGWRRIFGGSKVTVLYDGECGFCVRVARVLRGLDAFAMLQLVDFRQSGDLAALPATPLPPLTALERRIHVVGSHLGVKDGYAGMVAVALRIPALAPLGVIGSFPGAFLLGNPVYDAVAKRRQELHPRCDGTCALPGVAPGSFGRLLRGAVPGAVRKGARGLLYCGLLFLAVACVWFSFPSTAKLFGRPVDPDTHMPQWMSMPVQGLELWQKWDMFSANPADTDMYLVGRGELTDGTHVDVLRGDRHGGPMPPIDLGLFFTRWQKFVHNLAYAGKPWLLEFGRYICRDWNAPEGRAPLKTFKIYRVERRVPAVGKEPGPWAEQLIWDHSCF